jgi:type IV pilus assembly protein PilY1
MIAIPKSMSRRGISRIVAASVGLASACVSAQSISPPLLDLAKKPLFLAQNVAPNLFVTIDDSLSMRSAFIPGNLDNTQDVRVSQSVTGTVQRCGWQIPRFYSSDTNYVYYNPDPLVTYPPPLRPDGTSFPNADFNRAWVDGLSANGGGTILDAHTIDLETQYFPTIELNLPISPSSASPRAHEYVVRHHLEVRHDEAFVADDEDYTGCDEDNAVWRLPFATVGGSGVVAPAFYYRYVGPRNADGSILLSEQRKSWNYAPYQVDQADRQKFANWYSYYRTRYLAAKSAITFAFAQKISGVRIAWQNQVQNPLIPGTTELLDYDSAGKTAFFDWLVRHRMEGETPTRAATIRVGEMLSARPKEAVSSNPFWDPEAQMELSCRPNYHLLVTDGYWNEPNPPLTQVADTSTGIQFPLPKDWEDSSYPSYGGGSYGPGGGVQNEQKIFWNETSGGSKPTLADIAFLYWALDARTDLPNDVPPRWQDLGAGVTTTLPPPIDAAAAASHPEAFYNPKNDPARHQHLVNYAISFGVAGSLQWPRDYVSLRTGQLRWPSISNESDTGIDDLWHAAINSRGEFFVARDPQELSRHLARFLEILHEQRGVSSAATVSSGVSTAGTLAFKAGYDTSDWSGFVEAHRYSANGGVIDPPVWEAQEVLTSLGAADRVSQRNIITAATSGGGGIPFRWSDLPNDYRMLLDDDPSTSAIDSDGNGEKRLEWLRGDDSLEAGNPNGIFRARRNVLGAVAHASSVFVAAPSGGYNDAGWPNGSPEQIAANAGLGYAKFLSVNKDRRRQVIVGANDGMLHSFDAGFAATNDPGTGRELWAYIPREVAPNLGRLSRRTRDFEPFVDSSVVVRDAFVGGRWRTVLVGALRRGGQGFFALDVTKPEMQERNDASELVLWELSDDTGGTDRIGYSYGVPNISRLNHGKWVAVLPGGYNSHEPDGHTGNGAATVFIVDLDGGGRYEIPVPGATGLAQVTMGDSEGDGIDDFALAGTLEGDIYYFDLTASDPAVWPAPQLVFRGSRDANDLPLRPVTSAPRIFGDTQTGHAIAVFGTGRMLEPADPRDTKTQAIYAVRLDASEWPLEDADLAPRVLQRQVGGDWFELSGASISDQQHGWYLELGADMRDRGERVVNTPGAHFSSGAVLIGTLVPNGGNPCQGGLRGNFYVLEAATGLGLVPIGDSNGDDSVDLRDTAVGVALDKVAPSGTPALLEPVGGGAGVMPDVEAVKFPLPTWRRRNHGELE